MEALFAVTCFYEAEMLSENTNLVLRHKKKEKKKAAVSRMVFLVK